MTITDHPTNTFHWVQVQGERPRRYEDSTDEVLAIKVKDHGDTWLTLYPADDVSDTDTDTTVGWKITAHLLSECPALATYQFTHRGWWAYNVDVLRPYETDSHTDPDRAEVTYLRKQVTEMTEALRREKERGDRNERALEAFKAQVVEVGGEAAERNDWCSVYDEIMSELGLPGREREHEVVVTCTFRTSVTVLARNTEDAEDRVNQFDARYGWNPPSFFDDADMGRPYDLTFSIA